MSRISFSRRRASKWVLASLGIAAAHLAIAHAKPASPSPMFLWPAQVKPGQSAKPADLGTMTQGPWRPSSGSPLDLVKRGDAHLSEFKNIEGHTIVELDLDGHGHNQSDIEIDTPKRFRCEYAWVHDPGEKKSRDQYPISKVTVTSNEKIVDVNGSEAEHVQYPASAYRFLDAHSLSDWVMGFPKYMLGSIHGEHALTDLLKRALNPSSGCVVDFQVCDVAFRGRHFQQNRIGIRRKDAVAAHEGPLGIELICDAQSGIPVMATLHMHAPNRPEVKSVWMGSWRNPGTKFADADFKLSPWPSHRS